MSNTTSNLFLNGKIGPLYAKTALPIILVMSMNGLLAVVDALFLGHYVGAQALAAVTLMFPLYMLIVAVSTLVSGGMSSILARRMGANQIDQARVVFAGAHGLALMASGVLIVFFALFGARLAGLAAGGSDDLAALGLVYLRIMVMASPLAFALSLNADALRNEGRVGFMAAM
ncbi:MAG: MATE family efflux transporter, partial [Deltaproteobacteria bacterium]